MTEDYLHDPYAGHGPRRYIGIDEDNEDAATVANIVGMPVRYLSQEDIGRQLGKGRTMVNVWRARYKDSPDPFPAPDVEIGLGDHPLPGWQPERMDDIRAWLGRHPRLGGHREVSTGGSAG